MAKRVHSIDVARCIEIAAHPMTVWAFVHDPTTAVLTDDEIVQGFTMPGTPRGGLGERQCFVHLLPDGSTHTHMLEVIEIEPGHRAVTARVPDDGSRTTTTVVGGSVRTMLTLQMTGSVLAPNYSVAIADVTRYCDNYLTRVRSAIESTQH